MELNERLFEQFTSILAKLDRAMELHQHLRENSKKEFSDIAERELDKISREISALKRETEMINRKILASLWE